MRGNNIKNNVDLTPIRFTEKSIKKCFGFNINFIDSLENRLEFFFVYKLTSYSFSKFLGLSNYIDLFIPIQKHFKKRRLINIYFLDLISSYRGWRHSKGLPVRGQRT